ncbi:hypothetical protein [Lutibacter sp.]|uniref:hypothetical protein n=1 Tax=Lutibacter sp. TaxID=1925666 RepID=UPI00356A63EB
MNTYKNQSFLSLTLRFGIVFLVVVSAIKIIFSIVANGSISGMTEELFSSSNWEQFVRMQLLMSVLYGSLMAGYYKFIKK